MTDGDLHAIATYLKAVPGRAEAASPVPASNPMMVAGDAIYHDVCSACHAPNGDGVPFLFPSLANSSSVLSADPTTLIRVVLRGARSAATSREPTAPGMPPFGWQLDDDQIAAVLTYIRNSWGAAAPAVSPGEVGKARLALAARED
jgi:mono/diheme cytochrome c family protein